MFSRYCHFGFCLRIFLEFLLSWTHLCFDHRKIDLDELVMTVSGSFQSHPVHVKREYCWKCEGSREGPGCIFISESAARVVSKFKRGDALAGRGGGMLNRVVSEICIIWSAFWMLHHQNMLKLCYGEWLEYHILFWFWMESNRWVKSAILCPRLWFSLFLILLLKSFEIEHFEQIHTNFQWIIFCWDKLMRL